MNPMLIIGLSLSISTVLFIHTVLSFVFNVYLKFVQGLVLFSVVLAAGLIYGIHSSSSMSITLLCISGLIGIIIFYVAPMKTSEVTRGRIKMLINNAIN